MKKFVLKFTILCMVFILFLTACQHSNQGPITTIEVNSDLKIVYAGILKLNDDQTDFKSISPNGYVHYKRNNKTVTVESSSEGKLDYQLFDGNRSLNLDESGKAFVAESIKDMLANGLKTK